MFLSVDCTCLLKTLWENEKLLIRTNFSFSHSVFYTSGELSSLKLSSVKSFKLEETKFCCLGKG